MKCVENLHLCKASCCKVLVFEITFMNNDIREYYLAHGCTLKRNAGRTWSVYVPMVCPQLGEDNLCKIHDKKPKVCAGFNEKSGKKGYFITEGCLHK